ncbi:MAG TPA: hypothetical protein VEA99_14140 [Gemmatimonadaceae bacterium]|nr:hypothetical protein [Gemmatimonadaceae bacterium]
MAGRLPLLFLLPSALACGWGAPVRVASRAPEAGSDAALANPPGTFGGREGLWTPRGQPLRAPERSSPGIVVRPPPHPDSVMVLRVPPHPDSVMVLRVRPPAMGSDRR